MKEESRHATKASLTQSSISRMFGMSPVAGRCVENQSVSLWLDLVEVTVSMNTDYW